MLLAPNLAKSYILTGDGLTKSSPMISAPSNDFAENSLYAVIKGILFIFGGNSDDQKVKILKKNSKVECLILR